MTELPWMPLYWTDHLASTSHLTPEQFGAYTRILGRMWIGGGSLPNNPAMLGRIADIRPYRWKRVWEVIEPFFTVDGDRITQKRLQAEWRDGVLKHSRRRAAGSLGGQATAFNRSTQSWGAQNLSTGRNGNGRLCRDKDESKRLKDIGAIPSNAAHNQNHIEYKGEPSPLPRDGGSSGSQKKAGFRKRDEGERGDPQQTPEEREALRKKFDELTRRFKAKAGRV